MQPLAYVVNKVVKGFGRGSKQFGCPTANVDQANEVKLPTGIYCGLVQLEITNKDQIQPEQCGDSHTNCNQIIGQLPFVSPVRGMVCSFGYNPQFGNKDKSLEVHVLDKFNFNFYGAQLRVLICKRMRDEAKYNSLEELKEAIANDISNAANEVVNFEHHSKNCDYFLQLTQPPNGF